MPNEVGGFMSAAISAAGGIDSLNVKACVVGLTCDTGDSSPNKPWIPLLYCNGGQLNSCTPGTGSTGDKWCLWFPADCGGNSVYNPSYGQCGYYRCFTYTSTSCKCSE